MQEMTTTWYTKGMIESDSQACVSQEYIDMSANRQQGCYDSMFGCSTEARYCALKDKLNHAMNG